MSFRASVALTCTSVAPSAQRQPLPRRPWMPSCTTSECHFGASLHTPLHAPRRSALCATLCATSECPLCHLGEPVRSALCVTSHSAVLPARGYPSLFGSQCRLVANCQQRADATYGIFCKEVGAVVAASTTVTSSTVLAIISVQRRSCKTSGTV